MNIDTSGGYSPDKIYGQLTMPFLNKPVTINAHTPYDNANNTAQAVSKSNFYNNKSEMMVSIEKIRKSKGIELDESLKTDIGIKEPVEFPPESPVNSFNVSRYNDGKGVVYNALKNGYSASQSIVIGNAFKAYGKAATSNQNPVTSLLETGYKVS